MNAYPRSEGLEPEAQRRLTASLDRMAAEDRQILAEAQADSRPEDVELARRFVAAQPPVARRTWPPLLSLAAAFVMAALGIYLLLPGRGGERIQGSLGQGTLHPPMTLRADVPLELPVRLGPADRLALAVFSSEMGQPAELLPVVLPILESNLWTPTSEQIAALPGQGFLELTVQVGGHSLAAPSYLPFSLP